MFYSSTQFSIVATYSLVIANGLFLQNFWFAIAKINYVEELMDNYVKELMLELW